jgi:biopolymer transport protein TolR
MSAHAGGDELRAEINVTPLVDVVLVLLVILMLMTPLLAAHLAVELPVASHAAPGDAEPAPTLTIDRTGDVRFEDQPLPRADLAARLAAIYRGRAARTIIVAADRSLPYATVVDVLDACRGAGIERIGVVTAPAKETTP